MWSSATKILLCSILFRCLDCFCAFTAELRVWRFVFIYIPKRSLLHSYRYLTDDSCIIFKSCQTSIWILNLFRVRFYYNSLTRSSDCSSKSSTYAERLLSDMSLEYIWTLSVSKVAIALDVMWINFIIK